MHKNQLQELAQSEGINLPSYSSNREGPDHAPRFKASVTFNGEVFESPGYSTSLRQAEHAAAEVALKTLAQRNPSQSVAKILDESGICKNLLQETSQRAGVPLPWYITGKDGPGHQPVFTCTVQVAGLQFTGEPGKTKKQAEKHAALAAWTSLREMANKSPRSSNGDSSEEQEQVAIARILTESFASTPGSRSSPAVLANAFMPQLLPLNAMAIVEEARSAAGYAPAVVPAITTAVGMFPPGMGAGVAVVVPPKAMTQPRNQDRDYVSAPIHPKGGLNNVKALLPAQTAGPQGYPLYRPRHVTNYQGGSRGVSSSFSMGGGPSAGATSNAGGNSRGSSIVSEGGYGGNSGSRASFGSSSSFSSSSSSRASSSSGTSGLLGEGPGSRSFKDLEARVEQASAALSKVSLRGVPVEGAAAASWPPPTVTRGSQSIESAANLDPLGGNFPELAAANAKGGIGKAGGSIRADARPQESSIGASGSSSAGGRGYQSSASSSLAGIPSRGENPAGAGLEAAATAGDSQGPGKGAEGEAKTVSAHTSFAIRPGMAYQPRSVRKVEGQKQQLGQEQKPQGGSSWGRGWEKGRSKAADAQSAQQKARGGMVVLGQPAEARAGGGRGSTQAGSPPRVQNSVDQWRQEGSVTNHSAPTPS